MKRKIRIILSPFVFAIVLSVYTFSGLGFLCLFMGGVTYLVNLIVGTKGDNVEPAFIFVLFVAPYLAAIKFIEGAR